MECSVCNKTKEGKRSCFPCDCCKRLICTDCSELSATELKCMLMINRKLIFHCKTCQEANIIQLLNGRIQDKDEIISDKTRIIELLQKEINDCEEKINSPRITFAEVAKSNIPNDLKSSENFPDVIIKPKRTQDSKLTKDDVNKNIDPVKLKIGIKNMRTTKSGGIIIKCQTKSQTSKLEEEIKNKLSDKYEVDLTNMRKPRIKIVNFNQELDREQISSSIIEQNNLLNGSVNVVYVRKDKNKTQTIFCECSPQSFNKIMAKQNIYIGWQRLSVYEDLDVPRCFHCQGYYHKKKNCQNKLVCPICSEEHEENECPKQKKCCKNCKNSNEKYKTKYNIEHLANDQNCPTLDYFKKVLKSRTSYQE